MAALNKSVRDTAPRRKVNSRKSDQSRRTAAEKAPSAVVLPARVDASDRRNSFGALCQLEAQNPQPGGGLRTWAAAQRLGLQAPSPGGVARGRAPARQFRRLRT